MVPTFPQSTPLNLSHRHAIEKVTQRFPTYSDYGFTSLYAYDTEESVRISLFHGNLVLLFRDYISGERFYTFLGDSYVDETARTLIDHAARQGIDPVLRLIPQTVIDHLNHRERFIIKEDR